MKQNTIEMKWALLLAASLAFAATPACQPKGDDETAKTQQAAQADPHVAPDHAAHAAEGGCPHAKQAALAAAHGEGGCPHAKQAAHGEGGCPHAKAGEAGECGCGKHDPAKAGADACECGKHDPAKADAAKPGDCGCGKHGADAATAKAIEEADCGGEAAGSGLEAKAQVKDAQAGVPIATHQGPLDEKLGQALAGAPLVTVAELMAKPDDYDGKTIRLEGQVTDMCFHQRGWFGIADEKGEKVVRVVTGQGGFKVPEGAIGSAAKTEGKIKVVTLDPKQVAHYKKLHKFVTDADAAAGKPVRQPIVMASGAEFKR